LARASIASRHDGYAVTAGVERADLGADHRADRARSFGHFRPPRRHQHCARRFFHGRNRAGVVHAGGDRKFLAWIHCCTADRIPSRRIDSAHRDSTHPRRRGSVDRGDIRPFAHSSGERAHRVRTGAAPDPAAHHRHRAPVRHRIRYLPHLRGGSFDRGARRLLPVPAAHNHRHLDARRAARSRHRDRDGYSGKTHLCADFRHRICARRVRWSSRGANHHGRLSRWRRHSPGLLHGGDHRRAWQSARHGRRCGVARLL